MIQELNRGRRAVDDLLIEIPNMTEVNYRLSHSYLDSFFKGIADPEAARALFESTCR